MWLNKSAHPLITKDVAVFRIKQSQQCWAQDMPGCAHL